MANVPFEDSKNLGSLLDVNQLDYRLAPSLSVAVSRSLKTYPAHRESYSSADLDHVIFTATSGGQYVDLLNSYIRFKVSADRPFVIPPKQSMLNLFKGIRLIHSSGEEIDRVNGVLGLWNKLRLGSTACSDRMASQYDLFNYNNKTFDTQYKGEPWLGHAKAATRLQVGLHVNDTYVSDQADGVRTLTWSFDPDSPFSEPSQFIQRGDWITISSGTEGDIVSIPLQVEAVIGNQVLVLDSDPTEVNPAVDAPNAPEEMPPGEAILGVYSALSSEDTNPYDDIDVIIPLACLHDFFNKMRLCPVFLISGLRIELDLEHPDQVFPLPWESVAKQNYHISNATLDLESIAITDGIARRLAQISGSRGLVWNWTTVFTATSYPNAMDHSVQITKAVSRANQAIFFVRNIAQIQYEYFDSLDSSSHFNKKHDFTSYQFALGAEFMPVRPMESAKEFQHAALKCWEQFRRVDELVSGAAERMTTACTSLENSTTLAQAGVAINSQRTAVATMQFANDYDNEFATFEAFRNKRRVDMFLTAEKIAVIMLDSISLRS